MPQLLHHKTKKLILTERIADERFVIWREDLFQRLNKTRFPDGYLPQATQDTGATKYIVKCMSDFLKVQIPEPKIESYVKIGGGYDEAKYVIATNDWSMCQATVNEEVRDYLDEKLKGFYDEKKDEGCYSRWMCLLKRLNLNREFVLQ